MSLADRARKHLSGAATWRTLDLVGWEWRDPATAISAASSTNERAKGYVLVFDAESPGSQSESPWRLVAHKAGGRRAEFVVGRDVVTVVGHDDNWTSWSRGVDGTKGIPTTSHPGLGPGGDLVPTGQGSSPTSARTSLADALAIVDVKEARWLGHAALAVHARPRRIENAATMLALGRLGLGGHDYRLMIDDTTGILLRIEAALDGAPFRIVETTSVAVDSEPPPSIRLPGDPPIAMPPRGELSAHISLREAARRAAFSLWVPDRLPLGYRPRVWWIPHMPPENRYPLALIYYSDARHDGVGNGSALSLQEQPSASVPTEGARNAVEMDGTTITARVYGDSFDLDGVIAGLVRLRVVKA